MPSWQKGREEGRAKVPRGRSLRPPTLQGSIFAPGSSTQVIGSTNRQLLKWVGNKQRFAHQIISHFPQQYGAYFEPFLGSGAVLGALAPTKGVGSDGFGPLMEIWRTLSESPDTLKRWYAQRRNLLGSGDKVEVYERVKMSYNAHPNG